MSTVCFFCGTINCGCHFQANILVCSPDFFFFFYQAGKLFGFQLLALTGWLAAAAAAAAATTSIFCCGELCCERRRMARWIFEWQVVVLDLKVRGMFQSFKSYNGCGINVFRK